MSNDLLVLFTAGNFLLALLTFIILIIKNLKKIVAHDCKS
ncbi:putative holin-like toxin [Clostridium sp. LQ25]|nr:putative holin-like toxin [Clostridium sp. LQ25]UZT06193.1 putative holin-like toxin [Clostridium sp. LQ25]